jgi:hypothetical protein
VTVCQPTLLTWTGGIPPYFLDILDADDLNGGRTENLLTDSNARSLTWTVNFEAGKHLVAELRDSTGEAQFTASFEVQNGPSHACFSSTY